MQEEQRELAKTIRVSGSILLSTVSNFLDFFKMEAGKQLDVVRTEMTTKVDWLCQTANLLYIALQSLSAHAHHLCCSLSSVYLQHAAFQKPFKHRAHSTTLSGCNHPFHSRAQPNTLATYCTCALLWNMLMDAL